jgi:hypothetical protein
MAVAFRAVGAWQDGATGLIADEVLNIPAAQQTGDMMVALASWKDFAITANVSGWTEITEYADGSGVGTGNGVGAMKVGAWYKVATSDAEADPTLDFSTTTGLVGEATVIVFSTSLGAWNAPVFATADWPAQISGGAADSEFTVVPDGSAVIGLIGIRDDSVLFTRNTTSIDNNDGNTGWNGNYVEAPATHASTTTGNDMACDAGYRLVTIGGTFQLRIEATLSGIETGAILWVVLSDTAGAAFSPLDPMGTAGFYGI